MTDSAINTHTVCRDCAHFTVSPELERNAWEAYLGACHHWNQRIQHANSRPLHFGCGEWTPAACPGAAPGR